MTNPMHKALKKAAKAKNPFKILAWLKVAAAYAALEETEPEPTTGGPFLDLPDIPDEVYRLTIRISDEGQCVVVGDIRGGRSVVWTRADSPSEGAEQAMVLLDRLKDGEVET